MFSRRQSQTRRARIDRDREAQLVVALNCEAARASCSSNIEKMSGLHQSKDKNTSTGSQAYPRFDNVSTFSAPADGDAGVTVFTQRGLSAWNINISSKEEYTLVVFRNDDDGNRLCIAVRPRCSRGSDEELKDDNTSSGCCDVMISNDSGMDIVTVAERITSIDSVAREIEAASLSLDRSDSGSAESESSIADPDSQEQSDYWSDYDADSLDHLRE